MEAIKTRAYSNIALIKYWGKKDEYYNLCNQPSISYTSDLFYTDCKLSISEFDCLYIDSVLAISSEQEKITAWLDKIRSIYKIDHHFKIETFSNNPISAGLASSASAYASMALAVSRVIDEGMAKKDISKIARLGSGSASRSVYGGFSTWIIGENHNKSYAKKIEHQVVDFAMLFIIVSNEKKAISSRDAMKLSIKQKEYKEFLRKSLLDYEQMIDAIKNNDISSIGSIAERNSDMMHRLINVSNIDFYNDKTRQIIKLVKKYRKEMNILMYYTIDAGPNVKIIARRKDVELIKNLFKEYNIYSSNEGSDAYFK